jgi:outer membrane protein assembly factor BamA
VVRIFPSSEFTDYLNSLKDPRYKYQYTDHLIMALKYSLIFSNQGQRHQKHFEYFRLNMETSGNSLNLYSKYIDNTRNANGDYTLFNIRYAQYLISDFDFRYYNAINPRNLIVIRAAAGLGYAYGNSKSLPFEKGFYSGGANGMRGWRIRSLGPGAFRDTSDANFDKMGDILLEGNMEYRFPIYRFLKGAFFADAGNIWTLNTNSDFPDGKFSSSTFINQIAMDAGFGIRLDFSYFIFRIDGAIPIRSPSLPQEDRWIKVPAMQIGDIIWNFAIGYPF